MIEVNNLNTRNLNTSNHVYKSNSEQNIPYNKTFPVLDTVNFTSKQLNENANSNNKSNKKIGIALLSSLCLAGMYFLSRGKTGHLGELVTSRTDDVVHTASREGRRALTSVEEQFTSRTEAINPSLRRNANVSNEESTRIQRQIEDETLIDSLVISQQISRHTDDIVSSGSRQVGREHVIDDPFGILSRHTNDDPAGNFSRHTGDTVGSGHQVIDEGPLGGWTEPDSIHIDDISEYGDDIYDAMF